LRDIEVEADTASAAIAAAESEAQKDPPDQPDWKVEGLEVKKIG
jgi:hypothetical protein